jgi:hypothetical protein
MRQFHVSPGGLQTWSGITVPAEVVTTFLSKARTTREGRRHHLSAVGDPATAAYYDEPVNLWCKKNAMTTRRMVLS